MNLGRQVNQRFLIVSITIRRKILLRISCFFYIDIANIAFLLYNLFVICTI